MPTYNKTNSNGNVKPEDTTVYRSQFDTLISRVAHYTKYRNYMEGNHLLVFASDKYDTTFGRMVKGLVDNRCPAIISAVADKMQLDILDCEDDTLQTDIDDWAHSHKLFQKVNTASAQALTYGSAHIILSQLPNGSVKPHLQIPGSVITWNDDETDELAGAMKQWRGSDRCWRVTIWEGNKITRYKSKNDSEMAPTDWASYDLDDVQYTTMDRPPVFTFTNEPDDFGNGQSLLKDVIPMQNALNKGWSDMLVSMEFAAYRQRWATGVDMAINPETGEEMPPFKAGMDRLWTTANPDVKFGSFEATDITQYEMAINKFLSAMASCARVPMHAFAPSGSWPSGEAMRKAEEPLIARVRDRQEDWGDVVEQMVEYAMRWMGKMKTGRQGGFVNSMKAWMSNVVNDRVMADPLKITIEAKWVEYDNRDALAEANEAKIISETLLNKRELGMSKQQGLRELDYTEEEIAQMEEETASETNGMALLAGAVDVPPVDVPPSPAFTAKNNGSI